MNENPQNTNGVNLPMSAVDEIPTAKSGAKEIVALIKENNNVTGYKLSDGSTLSKQQAVELAKNGGICNVAIASNSGTQYLKSIPDGNLDNNLSNLPSETQ